jgi:hypothetical protein
MRQERMHCCSEIIKNAYRSYVHMFESPGVAAAAADASPAGLFSRVYIPVSYEPGMYTRRSILH